MIKTQQPYQAKRYNQQRGLTVIEMLMVVAVIGIILYGGVRNLESAQREADIQTLEKSVTRLLQAMRGYWYLECANRTYVLLLPPYTELTSNNLLKTTTPITNPLDSNSSFFIVGYNTTSGTDGFATVFVIANLNKLSVSQSKTVANRLKGKWAGGAGNTVLWQRMVAMSDQPGSLWIFRSDLERFKRFEAGTPGCEIAK